MKESYVCLKHLSERRVIATDCVECGANSIIRDYQDNIEEIFITENVVEDLENIRKRLSNEIKDNNKKIKKNKKINKIILVGTVITTILSGCVGGLVGFMSSCSQLQTTFLAISIPLVEILFFTTPMIWFSNKVIKNNERQLNGYNLELEQVEKKLNSNKKKLVKLLKDKKVTKSKFNILAAESKPKRIEYKEKLQCLRDYLNSYYKIGYYEEELFDYYEDGDLETDLHDKFNEVELQLVKLYFKNIIG